MNLKLCINIQKKEVQRPLKLIQRVFQNFQPFLRLARPAFFRFSNVTEFSLKKLITLNVRENVAIQTQFLGERGGSDVQHRKEKKKGYCLSHRFRPLGSDLSVKSNSFSL